MRGSRKLGSFGGSELFAMGRPMLKNVEVIYTGSDFKEEKKPAHVFQVQEHKWTMNLIQLSWLFTCKYNVTCYTHTVGLSLRHRPALSSSVTIGTDGCLNHVAIDWVREA